MRDRPLASPGNSSEQHAPALFSLPEKLAMAIRTRYFRVDTSALNFAADFAGGPCSLDDDVHELEAMDASAGNDALSSDVSSLTDSDGSAYADYLDAMLSSDSDQDDPSEMAESIAHAAP